MAQTECQASLSILSINKSQRSAMKLYSFVQNLSHQLTQPSQGDCSSFQGKCFVQMFICYSPSGFIKQKN